MNTLQIYNILKKELGHVFKGVYALDQVPNLKPRIPAAYVFNTKPSASPGEHWVAVYIMANRKAVYFDSLGFQPRHTQIIMFLNKHAGKWTFSRKTIQNPFTAVCGQHCIVFLSRFHRSKQIKFAVKPYGRNLLKNDRSVLKFVTKTYRLKLSLFPNFKTGQL